MSDIIDVVKGAYQAHKIEKAIEKLKEYNPPPPVILKWPAEELMRPAVDVPPGSQRLNRELIDLLKQMHFALMKENRGNRLGLAANQIGSSMNVAIVLGRVCINPKFTPPKESPKRVVIEGCYSTDGEYKVERWPYGWCEWTDIDGNVHRTKENGLFGWVMQHEVEHLSGHSIEEHGKKIH